MSINFPKAFTLVEVMATVGILLFGLLGALTAVTRGITGGVDSTNRTIATALATEGIELVRNVRDSNWAPIPKRAFNTNLGNGNWLIFYLSPGFATPLQSFGGSAPALQFDPSRGLYGYDSTLWSGSTFTCTPSPCGASRFTRTITIATQTDTGVSPSTDYLSVTSTVRWGAGPGKNVTLTSHLYDWRP